jgi:hypothetical protein
MMTRREQIESRIEGLEADLEILHMKASKGEGGVPIIDEIRETMMLIQELQEKLLELK